MFVGVGAWGPAVFSDDVARDVRDRYREHLEDQMADDEAEATILREFAGHLGDVDDGPVVWLALAATESKLGRLSAVVQSKALAIIDHGPDSSVWLEAPARVAAKRVEALAKLRAQVDGVQPPRHTVRKPKQQTTGLTVGDVLALPAGRSVVVVRVAQLIVDRRFACPLISVLDYAGPETPSGEQLAALADRGSSSAAPAWQHGAWNCTYKMIVPDRNDTWGAAGFELIGRLPRRPSDSSLPRPIYGGWASLAHALVRAIETAHD